MGAPKYVKEVRADMAQLRAESVSKADLEAFGNQLAEKFAGMVGQRNVAAPATPIWELLGYSDQATWDATPEVIQTSLITAYETESGIVVPSPDPSKIEVITGNGPLQPLLYNLENGIGLNASQLQKCRQINNLIDKDGNIFAGKSVIVNGRFQSKWNDGHNGIAVMNRYDWDTPEIVDAYWRRVKAGERGLARPDSWNPRTRKRLFYRKSFVKAGNTPTGKFDGAIVCFHRDKALGGGKARVTVLALNPVRT